MRTTTNATPPARGHILFLPLQNKFEFGVIKINPRPLGGITDSFANSKKRFDEVQRLPLTLSFTKSCTGKFRSRNRFLEVLNVRTLHNIRDLDTSTATRSPQNKGLHALQPKPSLRCVWGNLATHNNNNNVNNIVRLFEVTHNGFMSLGQHTILRFVQ